MILTEQEIKALKGLNANDVLQQRERYGINELPSAKKRGIALIVAEIVKEPMFLLLIACGVLYLILGDVQEALMLLGFVFVIIGITIYQERKTENALDALRDLSSPRALVIRDGERIRIPGKDVVVGDMLVIHEGDRVPADARVVWGMNITVDESLLTGESVPVRKTAREAPETLSEKPGGDDLPFIYSGTLVVQGQGVACVQHVGIKTEMGKIGKSLESVEQEAVHLQKQMKTVVRNIAIVGALLCASVIVIYGLTRADWLKGFLAGITLAMAILPEEFPVVLTIFLALGAWRIAQKNVLTRRMSAVETLGSATVLCTDKTGTLTENKMSIHRIVANGKSYHADAKHGTQLPENFHALLEYGILSSKKDPFDPMEKALKEFGQRTLFNTEHMHDDWELVREYPLSKELLALTHVWNTGKPEEFIFAAKGAPEAIIDLCHLDEPGKAAILRDVGELADAGLRVLGVAKGRAAARDLPSQQHDFQFAFLGLIGLADPVRQSVPPAIAECYNAGVRVVMITGDYQGTAVNIAKQIGLENPLMCITGTDLDVLSDDDLAARVKTANIFCRVVPQQKLRIVRAFKANGEIVAMTGDGVNDAPALKASSIGIAMGERGTDVARESADLVLLKDDFSSIVAAISTGRRIYDNIKNAMTYIFSIHVPIAGLSLLPIILGMPVVLYPVHIVFLELIIDPACSIVFENEAGDRNIMNRKPRDPKEPLFGKRMLMVSILQGLLMFALNFLVYKIGLLNGLSEHAATALTFATLIFSNLGLIIVNRSWTKNIFQIIATPNRAFWIVILSALTMLVAVTTIPVLQKLFHFEAMPLPHYLIAFGIAGSGILLIEAIKAVLRHATKKGAAVNA